MLRKMGRYITLSVLFGTGATAMVSEYNEMKTLEALMVQNDKLDADIENLEMRIAKKEAELEIKSFISQTKQTNSVGVTTL